jgi:hypothetical protein
MRLVSDICRPPTAIRRRFGTLAIFEILVPLFAETAGASRVGSGVWGRLEMKHVGRAGALAVIALLSIFVAPPASAQSPSKQREPAQSATIMLAVDLRELTSLRDVGQVGEVFFVRSPRGQNPKDQYDIAIRGSVAADWTAVFGGADDNRAPRVFTVQPGAYVLEKINIGSSPTTAGPGLDAQNKPRFGSSVVRQGEVLNLGRLVVHMHWRDGYFSAKVEDNTADARKTLAARDPALAARLQTRLLAVIPRFLFQMGGGR